MAKNTWLLDISKTLKQNHFYPQFIEDNIITVSVDKEDAAFLFLVVEPEFHGVVMSFSVDFPLAAQAVNIALLCLKHAPIATGENFYYGNDGELYWDFEAIERMELENNTGILDAWEPSNKGGAH